MKVTLTGTCGPDLYRAAGDLLARRARGDGRGGVKIATDHPATRGANHLRERLGPVDTAHRRAIRVDDEACGDNGRVRWYLGGAPATVEPAPSRPAS